ncbi:hypothetical protein P6U16_19200 [Rhizobium sp. 32-5/1]|uniref:hypothetical protein n=1 Tax=Rhizobium sp. 32-5/1 TaxID=3019602 RepID=UPI00240E5D18|nr:hypothetical protein [Rhizobium sp. 32-5/1]WEZ83024.1 hypothetical protein P6U16_19200 [Rhizobium sp. 32-5/1]
MIWIIPALAGLLVVYLAARFSRFRRFSEPVVSVAVAAGLISAFIVWWTDDAGKAPIKEPQNTVAISAILPENIAITDLVVAQGSPATTHHLSATIRNNSNLGLDYFTLVVTMQDCPNDVCMQIGQDEALVFARLGPGQSETIRKTLTFRVSSLSPPTAVRWGYRIEKIRTTR